MEEAVAPKRSGLGSYVGVKIIREMHRKRKSALKSKIHESFEKEIKNLSNFSSFCIKAKGQMKNLPIFVRIKKIDK